MQSNELKKNIIKLLKEDEDFRYTVAGLIGYDAILKSLDEHTKRFDENDKKFNEILAEITRLREEQNKLREDMKNEFAKVWDEIARLREEQNKLREDMKNEFAKVWDEITKLRQDMKDEFAKVWQEIKDIKLKLDEHTKVLQELKVGFGSIGRRVGKDLGLTILNIYKDQLMQLGIDPDKARRFEYIDYDGKYGLKGKRYEFDIVISNTHADILEVKSHAEEEDIESFYEKVNDIRELLLKEFNNINRLIIVAVDIDEEALEKANQRGIKAIYGYVIPRIY